MARFKKEDFLREKNHKAYVDHKKKLIQETDIEKRINNTQIVEHMNFLEQTIVELRDELHDYKKFFKKLNDFLPKNVDTF